MPNALADVGDSSVTGSRNSPLVTTEMQPKVCSMCAGPIGSSYSSSSLEASEAVAPVCVNCSRTAVQQDTPMNDATNATIVDSAMCEDSEQPHRSGTSDDIQPSKGNIIKDNNTTKLTLKVIKVDFPARSNADSVTPTTSPVQSSLVSARRMSLRSPVAEHTLSAALRAHIQRQSLLDPFLPLTSTRVPSRGYDCLYPGALFEGMQTNKTKEHRVSVRIVDVNTDQSTLSGFLTIHDLTDQHPEITTFFDGQIIGI
jgi:glucose-induced degradation protein 4